MGKHNLIVNQFLERKEIFADLINGTLFEGQQVLQPEQLTLKSASAGVLRKKEDDRGLAALERRGDIRMEADMGTYSVILANETQQKVHLGMPVRNMLYDALEYMKQIQELEKKHKEAGDKLENEEYLSGFAKEDRLKPVITTVFFCDGEWNGPERLHDLLGIADEDEQAENIREYLPDYKINLIQPVKMENLERFKTCLQHIFHMVKYKSDRKKFSEYVEVHREEISRMDRVAATATFELMGETGIAQSILEKPEEEEAENMASALQEIMQEREDIGMEKGMAAFGQMVDGLIREGREYLIPRISRDEALRKELYTRYCERD